VSALKAASRSGAPFADELAFAEALSIRAGELLMDRYERVERVDYKSARDVVTEVDHLSEELIIEAIRARFPDDGILAEESGEHVAVAGSAPTSPPARVTPTPTRSPCRSRRSSASAPWGWAGTPTPAPSSSSCSP